MKNENFNLTPLAKEWCVNQFLQFIDDRPERITHFTFDVREFSDYFAKYVNDYLIVHGVSAPHDKTATALCYSRSQMYRKLGK